ncbi:MAG: Uma2 family endonuclease [Chloroflexi bacterium]|nr:MAG: hypothetical protein CUN54_02015 [Phototrophicales bacterium]RMF81384.1 MAG: Uma2 family endonuclease [Chloroflexota bacterium]
MAIEYPTTRTIFGKIVSPERVERGRGEKFTNYEQGGVGEYWLIDPTRREPRFYRLNDDGMYLPIDLDNDGNYLTPLLPRLKIHVPTLWQHPLPSRIDIVQTLQEMLSK